MSRRRPRWGQNFLADGDIAARIVDEAEIEGRSVVEIGPGHGALTGLLAARASQLLCLEIDPDLASETETRFAGQGHVSVLRVDALAFDWSQIAGQQLRLVSNLPYESGTVILLDLLARAPHLQSITVMLQKEVAERVASRPGSKRWGRLGVMANMFADVEASMLISPQAFRPPPKVWSQLLHLRPLGGPRFPIGDRKVLETVVAAAFAGRRKMLRNNLGTFLRNRFDEDAEAAIFSRAGVAGTDRPEVVALAAWAEIAAAVAERDEQSPDRGTDDA